MKNTVIRRLTPVQMQADLIGADAALDRIYTHDAITLADCTTAHAALQKAIGALCGDSMLNNPSMLWVLSSVYRALTSLQGAADGVEDCGDYIRDARAACIAVVQCWQTIICDDSNPVTWLADERATHQLEDMAIDAYRWYCGDVTLLPAIDDDTLDAVDGLWDDELPDDEDDAIVDWLDAALAIAAQAQDTATTSTMDDNLRERIMDHVKEARSELAAIELLLHQ